MWSDSVQECWVCQMHSETATSSQERHTHTGKCLKSGILKGKVDIRVYKWGKALNFRKRSVEKVWSKTWNDNRKIIL